MIENTRPAWVVYLNGDVDFYDPDRHDGVTSVHTIIKADSPDAARAIARAEGFLL